MVKKCFRAERYLENLEKQKCILFAVCLLTCSINTQGTFGMQRRFMWNQMESNRANGFMGKALTNGARAVKNMFSELMPTLSSTMLPNNLLDYLPSETTRVKYIIRSPISKPMKVVKIHVPKKVVKIVTVPKAIVDTKVIKPKVRYPTTEELRKLEKEQEMIAEGHLSSKSEPHIKNEDQIYGKKGAEDIVNSAINDIGNGWKPIYEALKGPAIFSTIKPYVISQLHTNVIGERSPKVNEKDGDDAIEEPDDFEEAGPDEDVQERHTNTYEVTEYQAEESIVLPLIGHNYRSNARTSTTTTATPASTATEAPNYPASFLRKYRVRMVPTTQESATSSRFKASEAETNNAWIPSTNLSGSNMRVKAQLHSQLPKQQISTIKNVRMQSGKWPPELPLPRPFAGMPTTTMEMKATELPATPSAGHVTTGRKSVRLKAPLTHMQSETLKAAREHNHRGSVKFGDKVNFEDLQR